MNVAHILNGGQPGAQFDQNQGPAARVASQKPHFLQMTADQMPRNLMNNNYLDSSGQGGLVLPNPQHSNGGANGKPQQRKKKTYQL